MKINIQVDPTLDEELADFHLLEITPHIKKVIHLLQNKVTSSDVLVVVKEEKSFIVQLRDIAYVYVENGECKVVVEEDLYVYKGTLKSFEALYGDGDFIRLSKFCIANIYWINYYEASFKGSLVVVFKNGHKEYVSRNYTKALKDKILNKN